MVRILSPETNRFEEEITRDYNRAIHADRKDALQERTRFNQKYDIAYPRDYVEMDDETQKSYECPDFFPLTNPTITFKRSTGQDTSLYNSLFVVRNPEGAYLLFQDSIQVMTGMEHNFLARFIGEFTQTTVPDSKVDKIREITSPALLEQLADGRLKLVRKCQGKMDITDRPQK